MPLFVLEGEDLGKRHKYYNSQVNNVIKNKIPLETVIAESGENDVDQLLIIDVASHYKDVDYILKIFKSRDMLLVSRAIKKSTWLINDNQFAYIINPQNLYTELFPLMTSKAISKLLLHIRLHLKDEKRVEDFYNYYQDIDVERALKWLPNCSVLFIEKQVEQHSVLIKSEFLKRVSMKCPNALDKVNVVYPGYLKKHFEAVVYLLKKDTDKYLDTVEKMDIYSWPKFSKKHTAIIMKHSPERILNKFKDYVHYVHVETVAKYMKSEKIKDFILGLSKKVNHLLAHNYMSPFIKYMPKEQKFDFVKKVFIDKVKDINYGGEENSRSSIITANELQGNVNYTENVFQWYRHAPFVIALPDIKKMIKIESSAEEREAMLRVLLTTASRDMNNIYTLLRYYHDKHVNEPFSNKISFLNAVISDTNTHKYDDKSWNILDELFHSAEVYNNVTKHNVQKCIKAIIVYKVLHKQSVPEVIEKNLIFNNLEDFIIKHTETEKEEIFKYLYAYIGTKLSTKANNQDEVKELELNLIKVMTLLSVWDKELSDFPFVHDKIREVIKLKIVAEKHVNLSFIYNVKKSWRRYMFEESLLLSRNEEVYINALKHDPTLLDRHTKEVEAVSLDNNINLVHFLSKLKIYWSNSLAENWARTYHKHIDQTESHQAIVRGLCTLLPQMELLNLIHEHSPNNFKIIWSEIDKMLFSLRKHLSKLMYIARPQPPPASILLYAQGDYLQYALPSLSSIFHNLPSIESREHLSKILTGPVSLQKHGIRLAFTKLKPNELKDIFCNIWKTSKSATIRAIIFQLTFALLCREANESKIEEFWQLLEMFIDNLSREENPMIYTFLGKVDEVPKSVRAKFCMKSYKYLQTLPAIANCQEIIENVALSTLQLLDTIEPDFVANILLEFIELRFIHNEMFTKRHHYYNSMINILFNYILTTTDEMEQNRRFEKVLRPFLISSIPNDVFDKQFMIEKYFEHSIHSLAHRVRDCLVQNKYVVPLNVVIDIKNELERRLWFDDNYRLLTFMQLLVYYIQCYDRIKSQLKETKSDDLNKLYHEMWTKICPLFAEECLQLLKDDMNNFFPSIEIFYAKTLTTFYDIVTTYSESFLDFVKELMKDVNNIPAFKLVIQILPIHACNDEMQIELNEIRRFIMSHPSKEVRMHYSDKFYDYPMNPNM